MFILIISWLAKKLDEKYGTFSYYLGKHSPYSWFRHFFLYCVETFLSSSCTKKIIFYTLPLERNEMIELWRSSSQLCRKFSKNNREKQNKISCEKMTLKCKFPFNRPNQYWQAIPTTAVCKGYLVSERIFSLTHTN